MQLMRRCVLLLGLAFLSPTCEAALTAAQVKQVRLAINQMEQTLLKMMRLAMATDLVIAGGNTYTVDFSTVPFPVSAQQLQDIVNDYQALKAQLQVQIDALP